MLRSVSLALCQVSSSPLLPPCRNSKPLQACNSLWLLCFYMLSTQGLKKCVWTAWLDGKWFSCKAVEFLKSSASQTPHVLVLKCYTEKSYPCQCQLIINHPSPNMPKQNMTTGEDSAETMPTHFRAVLKEAHECVGLIISLCQETRPPVFKNTLVWFDSGSAFQACVSHCRNIPLACTPLIGFLCMFGVSQKR